MGGGGGGCPIGGGTDRGDEGERGCGEKGGGAGGEMGGRGGGRGAAGLTLVVLRSTPLIPRHPRAVHLPAGTWGGGDTHVRTCHDTSCDPIATYEPVLRCAAPYLNPYRDVLRHI